MLADAFVAVLVALLVYGVRFTLVPGEEATGLFEPAWAPLVIYAGTWVTLLYASGQYRLRAHWSISSQISGIARATVW